MNAAIIVAAGSGERAGPGPPKQFRRIGGASALARCVRAFSRHTGIDHIQIVRRAEDRERVDSEVAGISGKLLPPVAGGATRQESVRAGLEAIARLSPSIVLIHDAARPFVGEALIDRALEAAARDGAAVPAMPVVDTLIRASATNEIVGPVPREGVMAVQTPQAFHYADLLAAHRRAAGLDRTFTDDGSLVGHFGSPVAIFPGDPDNIKLTTPEDFERAERMVAMNVAKVVRVGTGFDVHAFGPGDRLWLGGVEIASDLGLVGHSDADVVLHAATDAVLGAIADGDIGAHFPPGDPQWRGAASSLFLADALRRLRALGGDLVNLDITVVCEMPKIGPLRDSMRAAIARIADVPASRVSVKATTSERLGFTGRGEGIAAMATATVTLPPDV